MAKINVEIDEYIAGLAPFGQEILKELRSIIHKACPSVVEVIKYGYPCFEYRNSPICTMVGYSTHCSMNFWKSPLINDPKKIMAFRERKKDGDIGILGRIATMKDIPDEKLIIDLIHQAMKLNEKGLKVPYRVREIIVVELEVPEYFKKELNKDKVAKKSFMALRLIDRNNYVKWVAAAKTIEARNRRINWAMEWAQEGKTWNGHYKKK